jgi:hypothetical protein
MNLNMSANVTDTVKYDEIKILVENGSYTVVQNRHLNSMETLFADSKSDDIEVRSKQHIEHP